MLQAGVPLFKCQQLWRHSNLCYLAYLDWVAEQGAEVGLALVSGQILLQTAHWKVLHDQLTGLATYEHKEKEEQVHVWRQLVPNSSIKKKIQWKKMLKYCCRCLVRVQTSLKLTGNSLPCKNTSNCSFSLCFLQSSEHWCHLTSDPEVTACHMLNVSTALYQCKSSSWDARRVVPCLCVHLYVYIWLFSPSSWQIPLYLTMFSW